MNSKITIEKNATGTEGKAPDTGFSSTPESMANAGLAKPRNCKTATVSCHKLLTGTLLAIALLGNTKVSGQTNTFKPKPIPNRFLIVIETSRAMDKRQGAIGQVLNQLLLSGMNGQLRAGDSLGLWTFNDELHGGEFALREWAVQNKSNITAEVVAFIQKQKFGKSGHITTALPEMGRLARTSESITIVLLSSGNENVTGTPFDTKMNESFGKWRDQQTKAHQPFVTVLRANKGHLTDCTVTPAPWPVDLPPLPGPPPVASQPAIVTTPARVVAPLIVSGRKTNLVEMPSQASAAPNQPAPITGAMSTNISGGVQPATLGSTTGATPSSITAAAPAAAQTAAQTAAQAPSASQVASSSNTSQAAHSPPAPQETEALQVYARNLVPDGPETNSSAKPEPAVVAVQSPRFSFIPSGKRLWFYGAAAFGTAAGIILLILGRSRHRAEPSFITHSMNRRGGSE
jgi:hypothetical protein